MTGKATFFETSAAFRAWLEKNHDKKAELLVGFFKKSSGKPSMSWPESVDQALCFGWIDGIHKRIDDECYTIRFTPRRPHSTWSPVNVRRARELVNLGLMQPSGLRAFEERRDEKPAPPAPSDLDAPSERRFRAKKKAWQYFNDQAPSYRRLAIQWVMSAKSPETRERRLAKLIDASAKQRRLT